MDLSSYRRGFAAPTDFGAEVLILLSSVDSTNLLARRLAAAALATNMAPPKALVVALHQSAGRGRLGSRWQSPPGQGVYASLLVPLSNGDDLSSLPLLAAVGLCRELNRLLPRPCRLKWPNDLVIAGRKIGGILIETVARNSGICGAVLGFGVNYFGRVELPRNRATSLQREGATTVSLPHLTSSLVNSVARELEHSGDSEYAVSHYQRLSIHEIGQPMHCRTAQGVRSGTFVGFGKHGFLRLKTPEGELLLAAGDIFRGTPGVTS
jgi:BirA family biotin operon repressor/biotin-[acetyl-CoA-carboxylase] ligase